ncbi:hypothetical protein E1193_09665 [Micromonospora sp. KC606]|uniref:glycoside hydrolase family 43 protein n=1 Tax=Micromonospora sp. KC606 TaxID=2530379 RepID=UPI00104D76E2|nr:glycoside hydrolase family 43 protein [Micromonospora sp. KC606]TDC83141.1 hypothetical protein E1193_09665 [Micromonospora sp. KC606]
MSGPTSVTSLTTAARASRYTNPVAYRDGVERTNPDPFVLRFRGRYWCYSSDAAGVNVSVSSDLVTWEFLGHALQVDGRSDYWAPCVIYVSGTFWMYFSNRPAGSEDPHEEVLQVATSDHPEGPFTMRRALFDTFSIDPHVVRDPDTGEYVMFYSTNDVTGLSSDNAGTSIVVDRMVAMDRLLGQPRPVVVPTLDEEIFQRNRFGDGRDWYTVEGATFITHGDTAFLTYSGNAYVGEDYFIGYARAALSGPVADLSWRKFPEDFGYAPLVRRNAVVEGTGHNCVVRAPNLVDDWIVYHGRDVAQPLDPAVEQRVMRIDHLFHDGNRLTTDAPTWQPQQTPAAANLFEDFADERLTDAWTVICGEITIGDHELRTASSAPALLLHEATFRHVTAEVYLRAEISDAGAQVGLVPIYHHKGNYTALLLDAATSTVQAVAVRNSIATTLATATLRDLDLKAWHLLQVQRTFDLLEVWVDGAFALSVRTGDDRAARLGLSAVSPRAAFSALTATDHLDLSGPRLGYLPRVFSADRQVRLTDRGLGTPFRRPVRLTSEGLEPGVVLTHEIEFVAPYGRVSLTPVQIDPGTFLRLELDASSYRVVCRSNGTEEFCGQGSVERHSSVRTQATGDGLAVRVGGHTYQIPISVRVAFSQSVELTGAILRSFVTTSLAEHPRGVQRRKEIDESDQ